MQIPLMAASNMLGRGRKTRDKQEDAFSETEKSWSEHSERGMKTFQLFLTTIQRTPTIMESF